MKTKINYRNEKGEFAHENSNYGFTVNYDFFKATCSRNGQVDPEKGNNVQVSLVVARAEKPIGFDAEIFGKLLNKEGWISPQWQHATGLKIESTFNAPTWREAFKKAKDYIFAEIAKYEVLVGAREQALIDAEF